MRKVFFIFNLLCKMKWICLVETPMTSVISYISICLLNKIMSWTISIVSDMTVSWISRIWCIFYDALIRFSKIKRFYKTWIIECKKNPFIYFLPIFVSKRKNIKLYFKFQFYPFCIIVRNSYCIQTIIK